MPKKSDEIDTKKVKGVQANAAKSAKTLTDLAKNAEQLAKDMESLQKRIDKASP